MSKENIKTIQNMLKSQGYYDLAIKLENSYYEDYQIDNWNGGIGEVNIFVNPTYALECSDLDGDTINILLKIFNLLPHSYYEIHSIKFSINTNIIPETIGNNIYIFVDEAGDMDFSTKGSKHYMFNFLIKKRPFRLHEYIANYKYSLIERNLKSSNERLDIERFHACEDNKYIREELFNIISTFDNGLVKTYSYILDKPKVSPHKRQEKDRFYIDNLSYAIQKLLDEIKIDKDFIIITDRLPIEKNKKNQIGALKKGIKDYLRSKHLNLRYDIFHHSSASSVNLQIVDYISWAIFRKYEHNDNYYYNKIEKYLMKVDEVTKNRTITHYEK